MQLGCEHLIDYFNEVLDEALKKKFEKHLSECNSCQQELNELQALTEGLPFLSESVEPPAEMKKRILDNVISQDRPNESIGETETFSERKNTMPDLKQKRNWLTPLLAGINKVNNTVQLLPVDPATTATVTAAMIQQDEGLALVIQGEHFQQLESNQAYQVWIIEGGKKYRAGTFIPNEQGEGAVVSPITYQGDRNWEMIAITLEPTPDSEQPQGNFVFSSEL